jgi:pilus assembly protein CpaE
MEVARIVLGVEAHDVAEEVMHFLDRTGRARVVASASDERQLAEAVRQMEPDAVVASTGLVGETLNGYRLLALETAESVRSLRSAIRVGASGYFVWPVEREALADAAGRMRRPVEATSGAPVVAVCGARGGAGTTFVATNLAAALARRQVDCALVDLDVAFAEVASAVGAPAEGSIATVADLAALGEELSPGDTREALWRHPEGFGVLLAPGDAQSSSPVGAEDYRRAIDSLRRSVAAVVLDVPRGVGPVPRAGLDVADVVIVVLQLDVASFRAARRVVESVGGPERCAFVVNRAARAEIAPADVRRVFGREALAVIPVERRAAAARDRGRLLPKRGRAGRAFDRIARGVLEVAS